MLGPNRNLVGAGVGHVEGDSITVWWFRNRRSPVDMLNLSHYLHGFLGGIIIWGLTSWEISRIFLLSKHGVCHIFLWNDMAQWPTPKISGSILAGTLWLCFSSMTAPAEMLWGSQVWVVFGSDEAWEGDNSNRFFECHCWWLKSPTTTTWDGAKTVYINRINYINYQPQLVQDFSHQQQYSVVRDYRILISFDIDQDHYLKLGPYLVKQR